MLSTDRSSNLIRLVALLLFAFSGCAGLIYESIWTQYLGLFLGHAAYAQSLVLAIFMGGMAVGAWWISARAPRWNNLLRAYAWIELAIGIAAALFHPVYLGATEFAYDHAFPALGGGNAATLFKWSLAVLLIFPQAVLLGATFPLMSNGLMRRLRDVDGAILSGLYFTNSMGAALGALVATFLLLPAVGLPGAMLFGAALNIFVAAIAFLLSREAVAVEHVPVQVDSPRTHVPALQLLAAAAFVTGATSFVYELGWVRMLCLVFGASMHAFELMLAAFVGGIALGGFWIRTRIDGYAQPMRVGGYVQILMGLAALLSLMLYDHSFDWLAWFMNALSKTGNGYVLYNLITTAGAIVIMLPAAFFAGMTLPLFTLALIRKGGGEASVGRIFAANTLGAIAGVFLMLHLMLPAIGLKLSMLVAAAGDLVLGMLLLRKTLVAGQMRRYAATALACAVALAATSVFARFDPRAMAGGVFRDGIARFDKDTRVIFYRDGKTASVASIAISKGWALIATNGKTDASIQLEQGKPPAIDEVTMVMLGLLPLTVHADPHTAAVIGFGSGLTTHTLLGDPRLEQVDTIEIEPAMYEGAKVFRSRVGRAYADPRSHVRFDDAKTYFSTNQARYDIIVSEPSNPWVNGVANLFSQEFYRFVPRHLKPGGVFVQWVQQYDLNDELVAMIARSLSRSFTDFRIYLTINFDLVIIASADGPLGAVNEQVFAQPNLRDELARVGLGTATDLSWHEVGDRRSLLPLFDVLSSRLNSDFQPALSLEAPAARFQRMRSLAMLNVITADLPLREVLAGLAPAANPDQVAVNRDFEPTVLVQDATRISKALVDGSAYDGEAPVAAAIAQVRTTVGACRSDDAVADIDALVLLAGKTIPFLDSDHLAGVWSAPRWITCTSHADAVREVLALLDALARRDFSAVHSRAVALLQTRTLSLPTHGWVLRAAMLAAIAEQQYSEVERLEASFGTAEGNATAAIQRAHLRSFAASAQSAAPRGTH